MNNSENSSGFVAGTLIHTQTGLKPIEQIQVGDFVLSKSETDEQIYKRVLQTFIHEPTRVVDVRYRYYKDEARKVEQEFEVARITTTVNHPFWVVGKGWMEAKKLAPESISLFGESKNKLKLCDGTQVFMQGVKPIYVSEQPGVGWYSARPRETDCYGYLWDYVNHRLVAEKVKALKEIQHDNNVEPGYRHPSSHYLKLPVYNLEVEDFHTYFIGELGVWVHDAIRHLS
jgi:hypothetical protein